MTGKKYTGKPLKTGPKPGVEGLGSPGQLNFDKERVSFVLPGSDEKNSGAYAVSSDKIIVTDLAGKVHTFTIKDGGKVLMIGNDEMRRTDYPW